MRTITFSVADQEEITQRVLAVHGDVHALIAAGVIDRTADGKFVFPYDAVRVEFTLRKVA